MIDHHSFLFRILAYANGSDLSRQNIRIRVGIPVRGQKLRPLGLAEAVQTAGHAVVQGGTIEPRECEGIHVPPRDPGEDIGIPSASVEWDRRIGEHEVCCG